MPQDKFSVLLGWKKAKYLINVDLLLVFKLT